MSSGRESDRFAEARPAATLCLTLLSAVTVVALCRVFGGWDFLQPMLVLVVGLHLLAFVFRAVRAPLWVAAPGLLLALFVLLGIIYYRETLTWLFPTGRTWDQMQVDFRVVLDQFATAVAPVPGVSSFATATAAVVGVSVLLSDTFAFRAMGRIEAVVPNGVLFVFASALGTDRNRVAVAALWIATALLTVAVLRFSQADHDAGWMGSRRVTLAAALPAILLVVAVSGVTAYALGPHLPGAGEKAMLNFRRSDANSTGVVNPFISLQKQLVRQSNLEIFSVRSSSGGHYWRMTSLPRFDGNTWAPIQEDLDDMGDRNGDLPLAGQTIQQTITFRTKASNLIPAAFHPTSVSPSSFKWADESDSLVYAGHETVPKRTVLRIESVIVTPSAGQLQNATVSGADPRYLELPGGVPSVARTTAEQVTAGAGSPYEKALALQNWFRDNFEYNTEFQLGNSNDAITVFLRDKQGFCQQFAGTYAVMARELNLPARVAVGFTPGELGTDGQYHVRGRHAHAWPEIWFDGIGWVAFEPTPRRGNPDTSEFTGVGFQQATRDEGGNGGSNNSTPNTDDTPTTVDPDAPTTTTPGGGTRPGEGAGGLITTTTQAAGSGGGANRSIYVPAGLLVILLVLVFWLLMAPRVIAALQRRRFRTPRERIIAAWHRTCHSLSLAGAPPVAGTTPLEYAKRASVVTGAGDGLTELAQTVTFSVYSTFEPTDRQARRCEALEHEVDMRCRTITPWMLRLRNSFDPRLFRRRVTG